MTDDATALSSEATLGALPHGAKLKDNRYEIGEVLGQGGFGITYRARDSSLRVEVAIKEYLPRGCSAFRDQDDNVQLRSSGRDFKHGLESFLKQIRTLAKFNHPNIVRVYDFFKAKGTGYMVTEYESGENLVDFLEHYPRLQEKKILEIIFPLLDGLGMVHMAGILHRDIKPSNIIVRADGSPCLLDFGTAREVISKQQLSPPSPNYSPPERFDKHGKQGPWTDIYALGAVCYRIIAGQQPQSALKRLEAVRLMEPDPLPPAQEVGKGHYRRGILKAIDCALRLDPAQRPQHTLEWRGMVVPIGVETQVSEHTKGGFLGKLRHMLQPPDQDASRSMPKAESEPTLEEVTASAAANLATESHSASPEKKETRPAEGVDYLSDERAESPSLPEVGTPPSEAEKAAASAHGGHAGSSPLPEAVGPASTTGKRIPPEVGRLPRPATTEPTAVIPKPRSAKPSARPQSGAAPHGVEPSTERPAGVNTPEQGMESPTKTEDALGTLPENSRQPSTAQPVGIPEPARHLKTPYEEKDWSSLFEVHEQSHPTGDIFSVMPHGFEEPPVKLPPEEPKAPSEAAISPIAAYSDRALQLFRDHDYAGALAELEAAKALEPKNRMLLANIKRVKQQLQGPTERKGDPWTTS